MVAFDLEDTRPGIKPPKKTHKPTPVPPRGGAAKKTVLKPKKEPEYLILDEPDIPKVTLKKNKVKLSLRRRRT